MAKYIFHSGCVGCQSQEIYGEERCADCQYLDWNRRLPDLSVSECEAQAMEKERARRRIKGLEFSDRDREEFLQKVKQQIRDREIESHMEEMESLNSMRRYSNELVRTTLESFHRKRRLGFFRNLAIVAGLAIAPLALSCLIN
jgi:ferric-dicitrate binding protein FerR (iron transport regulator)